jgi:hypothetical protein
MNTQKIMAGNSLAKWPLGILRKGRKNDIIIHLAEK